MIYGILYMGVDKMNQNNFKEIRKLKSRLPQSKIESIQSTSDKVVASTSVYHRNKDRIDSLSSSLKVNFKDEPKPVITKEKPVRALKVEKKEKKTVTERPTPKETPVPVIESTPKVNEEPESNFKTISNRRQVFLDAQGNKNENYVTSDHPVFREEKVEVMPRKLKNTGEVKITHDEHIDEQTFKEFYDNKKVSYKRYKFLKLLIFIAITYFLISFATNLYNDNKAKKQLPYEPEDMEVVKDTLGAKAIIFNLNDYPNVEKDFMLIEEKIKSGVVPENDIKEFAKKYITGNLRPYSSKFGTNMNEAQTNAFISLVINDLFDEHLKMKIKPVIVDYDMGDFSAISENGRQLIVNPRLLDSGISDPHLAVTELMIDLLLDSNASDFIAGFYISQYVDYDAQVYDAIKGFDLEAPYRKSETFGNALKLYNERLDQRLNSTLEEGIHSITVGIDKETLEHQVHVEFFTKELYASINKSKNSNGYNLQPPVLTFATDDSLVSTINTTLTDGESLELMIEPLVSSYLPIIQFNNDVLTQSAFNYDFTVQSLSVDKLVIDLPTELKSSPVSLCLKQSSEDICTTLDENMDFPNQSISGLSLKFDHDIEYKFYIKYDISDSALIEQFIPGIKTDTTIQVKSDVMTVGVDKEVSTSGDKSSNEKPSK